MQAALVLFVRTVIILLHNSVAYDPSRACLASSLFTKEVECIMDPDKSKERDSPNCGKTVNGHATKFYARLDKKMKQMNTIG